MRPDANSMAILLGWQVVSISMTMQDCSNVFNRLRFTREGNQKVTLSTSKLGSLILLKSIINMLMDVFRHVLLLYFMSEVEGVVEQDFTSAWGIASRTFDSPVRAIASSSYGLFMIFYAMYQFKALGSGGYGLGDLAMLETPFVAIDTV